MTWETGQSLVEYGLRRANELGIGSSFAVTSEFEADFKDYVNLAYWDIIGEFPWQWSKKYPPFQFLSVAPLDVTVSTFAGSSNAQLAAPIPVLGRKMILEADGIVTRIIAQIGVDLTLATAYPNEYSGARATIYQDEYRLAPDVMIPLNLRSLHRGGEIDHLPQDLFTAQYGQNYSSGSPGAYTFITNDVIQLGRWPEKREMFELWYTFVPPALDFSGASATDTPIVPMHIRWTIPDRALFYLLVDMDDSKASIAITNAAARLNEEKSRQSTRMAPHWWIPRQYRFSKDRH